MISMKKVMMCGALLTVAGCAYSGNYYSQSNYSQSNSHFPSHQPSAYQAPQVEYGCEQLVYDYGLSSSGQAQCGFKKYNRNVIEYATQCFAMARQQGRQTELENILAAGIESFNQSFSHTQDKATLCTALLQSYPNFVAR